MTAIEQNNTQGLFLAHLADHGRHWCRTLSPRDEIGSDSAALHLVRVTDQESMRLVEDWMVRDA